MTPIQFSKYRVEEKDGEVAITKTRPHYPNYGLGIVFCKCSSLIWGYSTFLQQQIKILEETNPKFSSDLLTHAFNEWKNEKIQIWNVKLSQPHLYLRVKVAEYVEGLFEKNGCRSIILGCMHAKVIHQANNSGIENFPPMTHSEEDHSHPNRVTVDFRQSPTDLYEYPSDNDNMALPCLVNPEEIMRNKESPDLANRLFNDQTDFEDLSLIQNVGSIYAERVPIFEKGIAVDYLKQFQRVYKMLAPGGEFVFDFGVVVPICDLNGNWEILKKTEAFRQKSQALLDRITAQEAKRLSADATFRNSVIDVDTSAEIQKEKLKKFTLIVAKAYANQCIESGLINRWREKSKIYLKDHIQEVQIEEKDIYFCIETAGKKIEIRLDQINRNTLRTIRKLAKTLNPTRQEIIKVRKGSLSEDQIFAIEYQLSLYNCLPLQGETEEVRQFLLPATRKLLDRAVEIIANNYTIPMLENTLGYEKGTFKNNYLNPENNRKFSRLISLKKPITKS